MDAATLKVAWFRLDSKVHKHNVVDARGWDGRRVESDGHVEMFGTLFPEGAEPRMGAERPDRLVIFGEWAGVKP